MSEVILIHPPISFNKSVMGGYNNLPPLGILYLAAVLEEENILVTVLDDLDANLSLKNILSIIHKEKPKIIGISATTCQIKSSIQIAKAIRKEFGEGIKICLGGCHISSDFNLIKRYPVFDFGVIGEGEKTFTNIVKKILKGERCKGIFEGEPVYNLDTLPYPAYHLVDMEKYKKMGMNGYPILSSRGCKMRCIFCSRPGMAGFGKFVRSRNAKDIVDEMETILEKYNNSFVFQDDSFTADRKKVIEFCQEVIIRKLKIGWSAGGVRIDQIDEELIELMIKSGCYGFCFGIESGSERIRNKIIHKGIWDNQIYKVLKFCSKFPINVQLAFVVGFPTETIEEIEETVMFGRKLIKMGINCIEYIAIMLAVPLPGSELFNIAIRKRKIPKDIIDQYIDGKLGENFRDNWPVYIPDGINLDEMNKYRKIGYKAFYFSPYYIKRRIKKDIYSLECLKKDVSEVLSIITSGRSRGSFS